MPIILVEDDDPQIRGWLRGLLESKGYQVAEARDGQEALAYLERAEPALVVLDIFIPKVDGLEIILHRRSCAKPVRILAISGNPVKGYDACAAAKTFGANEILAKPFSAEDFLSKIAGLLSNS